MLVSLPVSNNQGDAPINGYLIWGWYIDPEMIQQITDSTRLKVNVAAYFSGQEVDFQAARDALTGADPFFVLPVDGQVVNSYTVVNDIYNRPALLIRVSSTSRERSI
jgi:sensor domain CHASE-containing protein